MMSPLSDNRPITVSRLDVKVTLRFIAGARDEKKKGWKKWENVVKMLEESDKKENNFIGVIGNDMGLLSVRLKTGSKSSAKMLD